MFKNIVDLAEGLILNDQVTIDNWNLANNNADKSITLPENMKTVVNNIVKNLIKKNNEEIQTQKWEDEKAKIKPWFVKYLNIIYSRLNNVVFTKNASAYLGFIQGIAPKFNFYFPSNHQKTYVFLMMSGRIEANYFV